jgi:hypothetical protein
MGSTVFTYSYTGPTGALYGVKRQNLIPSPQCVKHYLMLLLHLYKGQWCLDEGKNVSFTFSRSLPIRQEMKYLGLHLNKKLTRLPHIKAKRRHLELKIRNMGWLMDKDSKLSLENKITIYEYKTINNCGDAANSLTQKFSKISIQNIRK